MLDNFPLRLQEFFMPYDETAEQNIEYIRELAPPKLRLKAEGAARAFVFSKSTEERAEARAVLSVCVPAGLSADLNTALSAAVFAAEGGTEFDQVLAALVSLAPACLADETRAAVLDFLAEGDKPEDMREIAQKMGVIHNLIPWALQSQRHKLVMRLLDLRQVNKASEGKVTADEQA